MGRLRVWNSAQARDLWIDGVSSKENGVSSRKKWCKQQLKMV